MNAYYDVMMYRVSDGTERVDNWQVIFNKTSKYVNP